MKSYDRDYFDRWYRSRGSVVTRAMIRRKAALVVAAADHLLERPARSMLDVGCGEAPWRREFLNLRPGARYLGIDSSAYAVARYGRSRNIRLGDFADVAAIARGKQFDIVVCSDVLHYIDEPALTEGLDAIAEASRGICYFDLLTKEDQPTGDLAGFRMRAAAWYAKRFARAGFLRCGLNIYIGPMSRVSPSVLEIAG